MPPGRDGDAVGGGWFGYLSYPDAGADGAARGSRGGGRLVGLRAAPGSRRALVVRKPFRRSAFGMGRRSVARPSQAAPSTSPGAKPTVTRIAAACWTAWRRSRRVRSTRRVCAPSSRRIDGAPDRLLRRRRGAHFPRPGGVSGGRLGRGGVAVSGVVPAAARRGGGLEPDQGHAAAACGSSRRCGSRSRTSRRTS